MGELLFYRSHRLWVELLTLEQAGVYALANLFANVTVAANEFSAAILEGSCPHGMLKE